MTDITTKVLIVDDDTLSAEDLGIIVAELGYSPLYAQSGREAISQYEGNKATIGLIVLDNRLNPTQERGTEVYDKLKVAGYDGPVMVRSDLNDEQEWFGKPVAFIGKSSSVSSTRESIKIMTRKGD